MRRFVVCFAFCVMAVSTMACGGGQKEVKSPDSVEYDAGASATAKGEANNGATADAGTSAAVGDATSPPPPPAPDAQPPSAQPPTVEVVVDGVTRPVNEGEVFRIDGQRMLFFYSSQAASDCSNVKVAGLMARQLAGLCQVGFLPLEQGFKPGQEADASITISGQATDAGAQNTTRSFRVGVVSTN